MAQVVTSANGGGELVCAFVLPTSATDRVFFFFGACRKKGDAQAGGAVPGAAARRCRRRRRRGRRRRCRDAQRARGSEGALRLSPSATPSVSITVEARQSRRRIRAGQKQLDPRRPCEHVRDDS